jgi:peptidoglycan/LPS O-acetylase OafA/YrhL
MQTTDDIIRTKVLDYVPSLDFIRALAIFLVIYQHSKPASYIVIEPMGVTLFFVLSGYLITRILLYEKRQILNGTASFSEVIKIFYLKRSLRIFPIYYLMITFLFVINKFVKIDIEGNPIYYITYTSNFLIFRDQDWIGMLSHTWSLCVEEQFYFVWPFIILLLPEKGLKKWMIIVIIIGMTFLVSLNLIFKNLTFFSTLPLCCFPAFALGGIMAYDEVNAITYKKYFLKICLVIILLSPIILVVPPYYFNYFLEEHFGIIIYGIIAFCLIILIKSDTNEFRNKIIYNNSFMIHIGKISYGIYLYHLPVLMFVPSITYKCYTFMGIPWKYYSPVANFVICMIVTYVISYLSWIYIEKPINKFKNRLPAFIRMLPQHASESKGPNQSFTQST